MKFQPNLDFIGCDKEDIPLECQEGIGIEEILKAIVSQSQL